MSHHLYNYKPLETSSSVRLLEVFTVITPGDADAVSFEYDICHSNIDRVDWYTAVSYVWGRR
jgi:hypothetical protein